MGLPARGLRYKQLKRLTAGPVVPSSGHVVEKVMFTDLDGKEKLGFFKALDSTYPELLACMSVMSSNFARLSLGDRAAEDRLVFDEDNRIVGTLSIALKDFKPLCFSQDIPPVIPEEKEKVIPSADTLLKHNMMELLVVSWFLGNDDLHPGNLSLAGLIDWDMYIYWITVWIKGPRIINGSLFGTPPEEITLTERDFENFPCLMDAKFTHWVTKSIPDNYNLYKAFPGYKAFIELARNLQNTRDGSCAQDQLFTAILKILLTWQPEVLRARLKEAFGDIPMHYLNLDSATATRLESICPELFNRESNKGSFVDFAMKLYQLHYDALYRVTVFYKGCQQNGKIPGQSELLFSVVPVPSFCNMLHAKPSMYHNIKAWALEQNANLKPDSQFDMENLEKRYHQIFRDSLVPDMKNYLSESTELALKLQNLQSINPLSPMETGINPGKSKVTSALELFSHLPAEDIHKVNNNLDCDKNSHLRKATLLLVEFNRRWREQVTSYFGKTFTDLTRKDNTAFVNQINLLMLECTDSINELLLTTTSWQQAFIKIIVKLQAFCINARFSLHIDGSDQTPGPLAIQKQQAENIGDRHTNPEIVRRCISQLFDWVNRLSDMDFQKYVENVIANNYSSLFNWYRQRAESVKSYLKKSSGIEGENRLAYILCSGSAETGALNTALIKNLIRLMLKENPHNFNLHFPEIDKAMESKTFDKELYTKEAIEYARKDERFVHFGMSTAPSLIHNAIFAWVNGLTDAQFAGLAGAAVVHHEKTLGFLSSLGIANTSRRPQVKAIVDSNYSRARKLAEILSDRGWEKDSVNTQIYTRIIALMQKEFGKAEKPGKGERLILQLHPEDFTPDYFHMVVDFCKIKCKETEKVVAKALMY